MNDLIRRDDSLKEVYEAICTYYVGVKPLIEEIAEDVIHSALCNVPAVDAVEVVRCAQCIYRGDECECPLMAFAEYTEDEEYCSYGERRENNAVD